MFETRSRKDGTDRCVSLHPQAPAPPLEREVCWVQTGPNVNTITTDDQPRLSSIGQGTLESAKLDLQIRSGLRTRWWWRHSIIHDGLAQTSLRLTRSLHLQSASHQGWSGGKTWAESDLYLPTFIHKHKAEREHTPDCLPNCEDRILEDFLLALRKSWEYWEC